MNRSWPRLPVLLCLLMAQLPQHGHCTICGRVVRVGEKVCSKECQEKVDDVQRQKKRTALIFILLIAALLLLSNLLGNRGLF